MNVRCTLFVLVAFTTPAVAGPPAAKPPETPVKLDLDKLHTPDETFWKSSNRGDDRLPRTLVGEYRGVVVDAPRCVPVEERATFPIGVYHVGTIREVSQVSFENNGVLTAMNVSENTLYVMSGEASVREERIRTPKKEGEPIPEGDMSSATSLELRELMNLPWKPSRYLITAMIGGQVSNRVTVGLCAKAKGCPVATPGPATQRLEVTGRREGGKRLVEGSFRVAPQQPASSVVVWVLVTKPNGELMNLLQVSAKPTADGTLVRGTFSTDVEAILRHPSKEELDVYAFSGEAMVGPVRLSP